MSESAEKEPVPLVVRFWSRVLPFDVRDESAHAWWGGHCLPSGYGTLTVDGVPLYSHRVSWELLHGPVPDGMVIRHLCNEPRCCRPGHLQLGTYTENSADRAESGRTRVLPTLTDEDILAIRFCYATNRWSQGDLALMFLGSGAGQPMIQRIVTGQTHQIGGPTTVKGRGKPPKRRTDAVR